MVQSSGFFIRIVKSLQDQDKRQGNGSENVDDLGCDDDEEEQYEHDDDVDYAADDDPQEDED